eukprot:5456170-Amphidinium_carterae.1
MGNVIDVDVDDVIEVGVDDDFVFLPVSEVIGVDVGDVAMLPHVSEVDVDDVSEVDVDDVLAFPPVSEIIGVDVDSGIALPPMSKVIHADVDDVIEVGRACARRYTKCSNLEEEACNPDFKQERGCRVDEVSLPSTVGEEEAMFQAMDGVLECSILYAAPASV